MKNEGELKTRGKSKRRYPKKKCVNPVCEEWFIPTDFRQLYCCSQCLINAANDRRRVLKDTRYHNEQLLGQYDNILETLYYRVEKLKLKSVTWRDLALAGIDKKTVHTELVRGEEGVINWVYDYGLMAADKEGINMKIQKRENSKNGKSKL
jgi:hypothetical protein